MSEVIKGTVTYMGEEKKYGNYGFKVSGYEEWFRSPKRYEDILEKGSKVTLKVKMDKRGAYELTAAPVSGGSGSGGGSSSKAASREAPSNDPRGNAIQWQHSQDMGIAAATLLLAQQAFKLGAANKPSERQKQILALIDELTVKFYTEIETKAPLKAKGEQDEDLGDQEPAEDGDEQDGDDAEFESEED